MAETAKIIGVPAGEYAVEIRDGNGDLLQTITGIVTAPEVVNSDFTVGGLDDGQFSVSGVSEPLVTVTITGTDSFDGTYEIQNTASAQDVGFLVDPSVSGNPGVGNTLTVEDGLPYFEGNGPLVRSNVVRRGATVIATDVTLPYTYTQLAGDGGDGVTIEFTLTNGTNSTTLTKDLVGVDGAAVTVGDASVAPQRIINPDGDGVDYDVYTFNADGFIEFGTSGEIAQLLLVGGGASGKDRKFAGNSNQQGGSGGDVVEATNVSVLAQRYDLSVGSGGAGRALDNTSDTFGGTPGQETSAFDLAAAGASLTGTGSFVQGGPSSAGNGSSGGGAGAGGNGQDAVDRFAEGGAGGVGILSSISGTELMYGAGAGGPSQASSQSGRSAGASQSGAGLTAQGVQDATPGVDGFGGGGGSANAWVDVTPNERFFAKNGGSGTIILRVAV